MKAKTVLHHVGLQCSNKSEAEIFFAKILEMPKVKDFTLSEDLSDALFGIKRSIEIVVYDNGMTRIEVFIGETVRKSGYEHICIEVGSKKEFISRCKTHGVEPLIINKGGKDLLFVKDFSDNLFEVKEKSLN